MLLKLLISVLALFCMIQLGQQEVSNRMNNATIAKDYSDPECICYLIYQPICASDDQTYSNDCFLGCARRKDPYLYGVCEGECPCCKPPYQEKPVNEEYGWKQPQFPKHSALEKTKEVDSLNNGEVKLGWSGSGNNGGCLCTELYMPVCGSNNETYHNLCQFKCAAKKEKCLTQSCEGECPCCNCKRIPTCKPYSSSSEA